MAAIGVMVAFQWAVLGMRSTPKGFSVEEIELGDNDWESLGGSANKSERDAGRRAGLNPADGDASDYGERMGPKAAHDEKAARAEQLKHPAVRWLNRALDLVNSMSLQTVLYLLFVGADDESTGRSWCSDTRLARPLLTARLEGLPEGAAVLEVAVSREEWRRRDHPYRQHPVRTRPCGLSSQRM